MACRLLRKGGHNKSVCLAKIHDGDTNIYCTVALSLVFLQRAAMPALQALY